MRKMSEITGEEAMTVTAEIISVGRTVTQDEELRRYLGKRPANISKSDWNIDLANRFFSLMLKDNQEDCKELLAAIDGKTVSEYLSESTVEKIYNDLFDLMNDQTFITLFFSSVPRSAIRSGS